MLNFWSCGGSGSTGGNGPALCCRSCGRAALLCGSSSRFQPISQPSRPSFASALKSLTLTAVRVRREQNRLIKRCVQSKRRPHSHWAEPSGRGSRLPPSSLFGYSPTASSGVLDCSRLQPLRSMRPHRLIREICQELDCQHRGADNQHLYQSRCTHLAVLLVLVC
jgi:hypothetical protein